MTNSPDNFSSIDKFVDLCSFNRVYKFIHFSCSMANSRYNDDIFLTCTVQFSFVIFFNFSYFYSSSVISFSLFYSLAFVVCCSSPLSISILSSQVLFLFSVNFSSSWFFLTKNSFSCLFKAIFFQQFIIFYINSFCTQDYFALVCCFVFYSSLITSAS